MVHEYTPQREGSVRQQHSSHAFLYGLDDGVAGLGCTAWVLWSLGYPDQALKKTQEMLPLAQSLFHPLSLAWALNSAAWHYRFRRDEQAAYELAEAEIALCTEHGFVHLLAAGIIAQGWALAVQGQGAKGIAQMHQGLATLQAVGAVIGWPLSVTALAEGYGEIGQPESGLTVLTEARARTNDTGTCFYEAEVYRLKGELTLKQTKVQSLESRAPNEAEECFRQAIDIAQRQSAKALELRAVMSLARLWQKQGKQKPAHKMLARIYNWFTEGFDTTDLREAQALLQALE